MVQLALWLAVCGVVALMLRNRVDVGVALVIAVWSLVPAVGGHHVIGISNSGIAFHPATWLVLCVFAVQIVVHPGLIARAAARHYLAVLAIMVFALGALVTSVTTGSGGTRLLLDQIAAPFLLWWLIVAFGSGQRRFMFFLRNAVLVLVALQCLLALLQLALGRIIFYSGDYETLTWFKPETFDRWMGTTDSPLVLSLAACIAAALAVGVRNSLGRFALLGLYLVATVITQSRTGTGVVSAIIVYAIVRSRMVLWARALAALAVAGLGSYLAGSALVAGLAARFADDTGSANARVLAFQFVYDNLGDFFFTGQGLISSYGIARNAGLETSLENSYLMYVIDTGVVLATLYFGCQLVIALRYGVQRALPGVTLAAVLATLLQHTFSAVAFANLSGTLIWTALGLVVVAWTLTGEGSETADAIETAGDQWRTGAPAAASAATSSSS